MQSLSIAKEAAPQSTLPSAESPPGTATTASSASVPSVDDALMKLSGFTAFLLSADNSVFADQHGRTFHDMSRPLPEYFISSSHNTYLVGHQLVGESTIEGYIRALLHSCRSVECECDVNMISTCLADLA